MNKFTDRMRRELERLALLRDDEIDTIDIPEKVDWSDGERSRFLRAKLVERNYDVRALANWFIEKLSMTGSAPTNLSLNKLVYFAYERFLVERNVKLTEAKLEAWSHGPVFREIYHSLKDFENRAILSKIKKFSVSDRKMVVAENVFNTNDLDLLDEIAATYGSLSASQLVTLSHQDDEPWAVVWNYRGRTNPGMEISIDVIISKAPRRRKFHGRQ